MPYEPFWLPAEQAERIHDEQISEWGGGTGIRDMGLLHSAIGRPPHIYAYKSPVDLLDLAAAYGYRLARNHSFVDGNKRTAYVCMRTFLIANGMDLSSGDDEKYAAMMKVASGQMDEAELADWLHANTQQIA